MLKLLLHETMKTEQGSEQGEADVSPLGVEGKLQEGSWRTGPDHGFILGWVGEIWASIWARLGA